MLKPTWVSGEALRYEVGSLKPQGQDHYEGWQETLWACELGAKD